MVTIKPRNTPKDLCSTYNNTYPLGIKVFKQIFTEAILINFNYDFVDSDKLFTHILKTDRVVLC